MYSSERILLIEDDSSEVALIKDALSDARIVNHLYPVSSGEEALEYFLGKGKYSDRVTYPLPCLVLLDLKIPGMGGLDVLGWIRKESQVPKVPVVILTHSTNQDDLATAYELGANSYLVKPFDLQAFRKLVKGINSYWIVLSEKPRL